MSERLYQTKSYINLNKYEPTKVLNKKGLLNEAAIKCRYDLMYINDYYRLEGEKLKDDNIFLKHRGECDRDIINFKKMIFYDSNDELMYRAGYIKNKILKSEILEKLDNLDHSESSKTREIVMKAKKEYTSRVSETLTNDSVCYKEFKIKERREIIQHNRKELDLLKLNNTDKNLNLSIQRAESKDTRGIRDDRSVITGGIGSNYYHSPQSIRQLPENKNSNSAKKRMLNYGKVPKLRKKSRIIKEGSFTDHIEGYQNIKSNSSNLLDYLNTNKDLNILPENTNNPSYNLPDIYNNKTPKNKFEEQKEFTNVSLEGEKVYLMKNFLYTPEEKEARMLKVASMNTVLNNSQIRNVLKKRNSKKFVHEILSGVTGVSIDSTNNYNLPLKTDDGNSYNNDNYNNSYSEYGKSMMNKLHALTTEDTLSQEKIYSNQNTNKSNKRSTVTIKMNGRDILKKIYTGGPMVNDSDSSNKKTERKIPLTSISRNTLGRQSTRLPSYLIQAKNTSRTSMPNLNNFSYMLNHESANTLENSSKIILDTEPNSNNFKTYSQNEENLLSEPNNNQFSKKNRITFDEINNRKSNRDLKNHYSHLNNLTNKIDDEFKNFNKIIDKIVYHREEDDLYYFPQTKFLHEDLSNVDVKKFLKRNLTFELD